MKKTVQWDDHLFEVRVTFDRWGVNYYVYLVTHPERKRFFRSVYIDTKCFFLESLESVEQGIWIAVKEAWKREQNRLNNEKKIADFKKSC